MLGCCGAATLWTASSKIDIQKPNNEKKLHAVVRIFFFFFGNPYHLNLMQTNDWKTIDVGGDEDSLPVKKNENK